MLRDPILDGSIDCLLLAADDLCHSSEQYRMLNGALNADFIAWLTDLRDDMGQLLARYEDGPARRYAWPSLREELRRLEGLASSLASAPLAQSHEGATRSV